MMAADLRTSDPALPASRRRFAWRHPLAGLLVLVGVLGVSWALFVPPWQSPDEIWHYAYAQSLGERLALPGAARRASFSTDLSLAITAAKASQLAFYSDEVRADWSPADQANYRRAAAHDPSRSDGGGFNSESSNPPLLYLYDDLAYWASSGGDAFTQLYAMRIWNVTLLLATVIGAWLLAGEVFGRRRLPQLACAALVGLIPMQSFMLTSINPDALISPLWMVALWLGVRVIKRAAPTLDATLLCAVTATAILTKATSYALVPAILVALGLGWLRHPRAERVRCAIRLSRVSLALLVPVLGWVGASEALGRPVVNAIHAPAGVEPHPFILRQFLSYLWQFYLPRLPFLTRLRTTTGLPVYDIWIRQGWGIFGYVDVVMPPWIYAALAAVTSLVAVAVLGVVARIRDRAGLELVAFFGVAFLGLLALLHVSDYRSIIAGDGELLQGRYLLPMSGLFGLAVGLITTRIPSRWRGRFCGALVGALVLVQMVALAAVARSYYT